MKRYQQKSTRNCQIQGVNRDNLNESFVGGALVPCGNIPENARSKNQITRKGITKIKKT